MFIRIFDFINIIIAIVFIILIYFVLYFVYRNNLVFNERQRVLKEISELCYKYDDCKIRIKLYKSVFYNKMVYSFKPVESFYKNYKCLEDRRLGE